MKNPFYCFVVMLVCVTLSSCIAAKSKQVRLDPEGVCPPGEKCVAIVSGGMDVEGGGVQKSTYIYENTKVDDKTTVTTEVNPVYASNGADRLDTIGATVIGGAFQLGGERIAGNALRSAARTTANGMVNAAKENAKAGPKIVNNVSSNSSSQSQGGNASALTGPTSVKTQQTQSNESGINVSVSTKSFNPLSYQ